MYESSSLSNSLIEALVSLKIFSLLLLCCTHTVVVIICKTLTINCKFWNMKLMWLLWQSVWLLHFWIYSDSPLPAPYLALFILIDMIFTIDCSSVDSSFLHIEMLDVWLCCVICVSHCTFLLFLFLCSHNCHHWGKIY